MFDCDVCGATSDSKEKPVQIVSRTRQVQYHNEFWREDEYGKRQKHEVDSFGSEIVKESKMCRECANDYGIEVPPVRPKQEYLPKFQETLVPPDKNPLIKTVVHNALDRLGHKGKRAKQDCSVIVPGIKEFIDRNKEFVF